MKQKTDSLIIIVSAPSGSGKTTLINQLVEEIPGIKRSISYTSREPREGERDQEDYVFIPKEEFEKKIEENEFLEWEENFGNYYGTSKVQFQEAMDSSQDIVLSIDVKGARKLRERFPESISVFIMPPSAEELAARLQRRSTDEKEQVSIRLKEAEREMASSDEYDYLIVNENLEKAVKELKGIIETERDSRKTKA